MTVILSFFTWETLHIHSFLCQKDLLTVRVSMKGSLNLARLTHVLPDDMTMLFASSNPREIHIPTTCSQRKKLCLVLKKLTFIG
jgi:hypothetical protein